MSIQSYRDVPLPFDTEFADRESKVRILAVVANDWACHVIGYTYYDDPLTSCSQVLEWDENGIFGGGGYPSMNLAPPPGQVEARAAAMRAEIEEIDARLAAHPNAPAEWTDRDMARRRSLEEAVEKLAAPHIWGEAA